NENVIDAVVKKGDPLRVMEIFPRCADETQETLESALLTRPDLPVKESVAALAHADEGTVRLATRLLGRVKDPDASVRKAAGETLTRCWEPWQQRRAGVNREGNAQGPLDKAGQVVESLLYTAGRVGVPAQVLADIAKARPDDHAAKGIRLEAVRCLTTGKI